MKDEIQSTSSSSSSMTFKFLITTDNHLGYQERDPRRGNDSFTTFEECLRAARVEHNVDAILLGGDLFHDNKPSLGCLARTTSLLRSYVLGDKPIEFSLLSDPKRNFPTHPVPLANFQDPNINVAIPIFIIHGNHDDPVGGTSSIDILAINGLVNYFGQVPSLDDIIVEPVLLKKGNTYVALYGLGNVRDERLHRCFRMKKLHFIHPKPIAGRRWFKILLLHQNRGVRGGPSDKGGIFETMLSGFGLDLVIWGNEHEQQMIPVPSDGFDIIQPGSTILTSLSGQECNPKKYGILEIREGSYRLTPFLLKSVRPVVRRTIELWRENPTGRTLDAVEDFLKHIIEEMIEEAEAQISKIPDDVLTFHPNIKFPLMRLSVDFTDPESTNFPQPNLNRFGQHYMDVVVNPGDLLRPIKPKPTPRVTTISSGANASYPIVPIPQLNISDIRTKVAEVFNANAKDACSLLSEPEVSAAVYAFAEKGERDAIDERIGELLTQCQKSIWKKMGRGDSDGILKPDFIYDEVVKYKQGVNKHYANITRTSEISLQEKEQKEKEEEEQQHLLRQNGINNNSLNQNSEEFVVMNGLNQNGIPLGESISSNSHIRNIELNRIQGLEHNYYNKENFNNNSNNKDEDEDALPDTGLMPGTVDALIANAVKGIGINNSGVSDTGIEIINNNNKQRNVNSGIASKRQREEINVDDDDDDDDDMDYINDNDNSNHNNKFNDSMESTTKGRGRGKTSSATAATNKNPSYTSKTPRGKKGKQNNSISSTSMATPQLQLTFQNVPGERVSVIPPMNNNNNNNNNTKYGALNALSKWSSQS